MPANVALEFSIQYESVVAFGHIRIIEDVAEKQQALYRLIKKYFPTMTPGQEYRPITDKELGTDTLVSQAIIRHELTQINTKKEKN